MTRLWPDDEIIDVELRDSWPARFTWQGHSHVVQRVYKRWQVDSDWWEDTGRVWREYLMVITTDGLLCTIFYDLLSETWHFSGVYD